MGLDDGCDAYAIDVDAGWAGGTLGRLPGSGRGVGGGVGVSDVG